MHFHPVRVFKSTDAVFEGRDESLGPETIRFIATNRKCPSLGLFQQVLNFYNNRKKFALFTETVGLTMGPCICGVKYIFAQISAKTTPI